MAPAEMIENLSQELSVKPSSTPPMTLVVGSARFEGRLFHEWREQTSKHQEADVCILGSCRWLLLGRGEPSSFDPAVDVAASPPAGAYLFPVHHGYASVRVGGRRARAHLERFIMADLGSHTFIGSTAVRVRFAEIAVIVHRLAQDEFFVHAPRSYGQYASRLLETAP